MLLSAKPLFKISLLACLMFSVCFLSGCRDDDDAALPLTYDATKHIYATTYAAFSSSDKQEIIINPQTGAYDTVPGTQRIEPLNFPSGTKNLVDFSENKRVSWSDRNQHLVVQNLETLESTIIEIEDSATGTAVINPQFFTFGANNDIVYIFDAYRKLWLVDLSANTAEILYSDLNFDNQVIDNQLYLASTNELIYGAHIGPTNEYISTTVFTLNLTTGEINSRGKIPASFGWVMHPENESIYGLTISNDEQGFRLMQLQLTSSNVQTQLLSQEDLAIDYLSFHAQTIHSATSTYICRGGQSVEGMLENTLYSIDLSNGELNRTITINEVNGNQITIHSLNGE